MTFLVVFVAFCLKGISTSTILAPQHSTLVLHCNVTTPLPLPATWFKENGTALDEHRVTVDGDELTVQGLRMEDEGTWWCEKGGEKMSVKVVVLVPPSAPYLLIDNRMLDPTNHFIPVKEHSPLNISCAVDGGNPTPLLQWDITGAVTLDTGDGNVEATDSDIVIKEVKREMHNATIECKLIHPSLLEDARIGVLLDVQYTPSFLISRTPDFGIPILEGSPLSLRCEVDANPPSAPEWQRDNGPTPVAQQQQGVLTFTHVTRQHAGWYKCVTAHAMGPFSSIGYYLNVRYEPSSVTTQPLHLSTDQLPNSAGGAVQLSLSPPGTPTITPSKQTVSVAEGDTVRLEAQVCEANEIVWVVGTTAVKDGKVGRFNGQLKNSSSSCWTTLLIIAPLSMSDSHVELFARSSKGVAYSLITLNITKNDDIDGQLLPTISVNDSKATVLAFNITFVTFLMITTTTWSTLIM